MAHALNEVTHVLDRRLTIPGCRLVESIGRGGTGVVWRAERAAGWCVVKILRDDLDGDPILARRFLREARITALLDHPGIARVYDAGRAAERLYITAEYVHGRSLADVVQEARRASVEVPLPIVIGLAQQASTALTYAHDFVGPEGDLHLVHRDLSPQNIMVRFDGRVCLIDFGVARAAFGDELTKTGTIFGTPAYMAPEQARTGAVDRRADVYALSVVLFELLTNHTLVSGTSLLDRLRSVENDVAPAIRSVNPALPPGFDAVFEAALQKDPRHRLDTAAAFEAALLNAAPPPADACEIADFLATLYDEPTRRTPLLSFGMPDDAGARTRTEVPLGVPRPAMKPRSTALLVLLLTAGILLGVSLLMWPASRTVAERAPVAPETKPGVSARATATPRNEPVAPEPVAPAPATKKTTARRPRPRPEAPIAGPESPSPPAPRRAATALLEQAVRLHRAEAAPGVRRDLERLIAQLTLVANGTPSVDDVDRLGSDLEQIRRRARPRP